MATLGTLPPFDTVAFFADLFGLSGDERASIPSPPNVRTQLEAMLSISLTPREFKALTLHYQMVTRKQIAAELAVTPSRVSQLILKAMRKLRYWKRASYIRRLYLIEGSGPSITLPELQAWILEE